MSKICSGCSCEESGRVLCEKCVNKMLEGAMAACRQNFWHKDMREGQNSFIRTFCQHMGLDYERTLTGDRNKD